MADILTNKSVSQNQYIPIGNNLHGASILLKNDAWLNDHSKLEDLSVKFHYITNVFPYASNALALNTCSVVQLTEN